MTIILEALFAALVAADTWLTYRIIESGKGTEVGPIARHYIGNKWATIGISLVAVAALIAMLRITGFWWMLIPVDLYMARLVYRNLGVLHG